MTAEEPYQDMPLMQVVVSVVRDGMRPPIPDTHAATPYADLMRACWSEEPPQRPSFDDICGRLEVMLQELEEQEYACVCRAVIFFSCHSPPPFFCSPTFNRKPEGEGGHTAAMANFSMESSISSPR